MPNCSIDWAVGDLNSLQIRPRPRSRVETVTLRRGAGHTRPRICVPEDATKRARSGTPEWQACSGTVACSTGIVSKRRKIRDKILGEFLRKEKRSNGGRMANGVGCVGRLLGVLVVLLGLAMVAEAAAARSAQQWQERDGSLVGVRGQVRGHGRRQQGSTMAYVTLLYGDEFTLGVRVLGKSIRNTGTSKDTVALVSGGVSAEAMRLLEADGWIVTQIELLSNPNSQRPARFWGVYTKLKVFNMTNYEKVVFLDADTIVTQSIEDLFDCRKFCANLKHSERLNSGVMVVEPSAELFLDMLSKVGSLPSYTGGDQGFLNSYYVGFANADLFDPSASARKRAAQNTLAMERLSTLYNADVGLYVLANKWMVDNTSELRVVHYTLGPLKPWDWWTHWLLKPVDFWQDIRVTLDESLPGTRAGQTPRIRLKVRLLLLLPLLFLAFTYRRTLCRVCYRRAPGAPMYLPRRDWSPSNGPALGRSAAVNGGVVVGRPRIPAHLGSVSVVVGFGSMLLSLALAMLLIPNQVMPWTGMILLYEWTFFGFLVLFGKYLSLVHGYGRRCAAGAAPLPFPSTFSGEAFPEYNAAKRRSRHLETEWWDSETTFYGAGIVALAVTVPSVSFALGVSAMFGRLGLTVAAGIVFATFLTYASEHLAITWFLRGLVEGS